MSTHVYLPLEVWAAVKRAVETAVPECSLEYFKELRQENQRLKNTISQLENKLGECKKDLWGECHTDTVGGKHGSSIS